MTRIYAEQRLETADRLRHKRWRSRCGNGSIQECGMARTDPWITRRSRNW